MAEQRLIDANVVYEMGHRTPFHIGIATLCDLKDLLDDVPTADAVPVVRCKDCQKGHPELAPNGGVWCAIWNHIFGYDEFCSKAEKREA
ncbi:MAG: hypothetical protein J6K89_01550 [Oscillospiraceae bacterium]|nr:hypothetical protein [Oscillospiraceae bacterium]